MTNTLLRHCAGVDMCVVCVRLWQFLPGVASYQRLGLNYLFLCECKELRSPVRDQRLQAGGVHGNAILSK